MRGVLVGAAPRAARNRNTAKCGVKRLRGARGAPPTSEGKSTYFIAGAISETHGLGSADSPRSASRMRSGIPRQRPAPRYGDEAVGRDPCGERERDRGFEGRDELDQGDKRDRVGEARLATERG